MLTLLIGKFRSQIWHLRMLDDDERTLQQSLDANRFAARCALRGCFRCTLKSRGHPIWTHCAQSNHSPPCAAETCTCLRWSQSSRFVCTRFVSTHLSTGPPPTGLLGSEVRILWPVQDRAWLLPVVRVSPSAACTLERICYPPLDPIAATHSRGVSGWTSLRFPDVDSRPLLHAGQH